MLDKNILAVRDRASVFKVVDNRPAHVILERQSQMLFRFLLCERDCLFTSIHTPFGETVDNIQPYSNKESSTLCEVIFKFLTESEVFEAVSPHNVL